MAERNFELISPAFDNGDKVPTRHTCEGDDISPRLEWTKPPEGTRSLALIVDDPDAPDGTFTHCLLFDLPAERQGLEEGAREVGVFGKNDFQKVGWGGPCPPTKHGDHRYFFHLYALDTESIGLGEGATRPQIEKALEGHVLGEATLMGRFARD